jgi:hypothetical protein
VESRSSRECRVFGVESFTWDVVTLFDKKNEILYGWSQNDF